MAQAQAAQNTPPVEDRMTFPPFPVPPQGVTIITFKSYIETGIRMFPLDGDDTERDGLGIPTIPLEKNPHKTNKCKTETKRKRKQTAPKKIFPPGTKKEWYDDWEEGEDLRVGGPYNPLMSPIDRLYEASNHFKRGRTWPNGPPSRSLGNMWEQFCLFVGLRSNTPVWNRTDKEKKEEDEGPESDDEEGLDKESAEVIGTNKPPNKHHQSRGPIPRPPYALYGKDPIPVGSDAEVTDLVEKENVRREEAMIDFLNDPEGKIKVFLSSYMRKQGLIWYDRNLIFFPKLVNFFLNFVLRSRVFINEPDLEKGFKKAIEVATLAEKELILTSKTSKELPDKFARAMKECWGQKADGYKMIEPVSHPVYPTRGSNAQESEIAPGDSTDGEPQAKRQKTDNDDSKDAAKETIEKLRKELGNDDIELLNAEDLVKEGQAREVLSDNLDASISAKVEGSGWGNTDNSTSEWGNPSWGDSSGGLQPSEEFLASMDAEKVDVEKEENEWTNPSPAAWDPPEVHTLLPLLGPSALPLTHTSGIVEWSLRRVKSFTPPPDPVTIPKSALSSEPSADAVEAELERRFAKLVMEPWIGWDKANDELPHLTNPRILETSKGPVAGIIQEDGQVKPDPAGAAATAPADGPRPHDPSKDEITVLVDPEILPAFCEGLGIGATWVQLAREQDFATDGKKKKKSKKNTRFWYAEEVLMVIPSFHT